MSPALNFGEHLTSWNDMPSPLSLGLSLPLRHVPSLPHFFPHCSHQQETYTLNYLHSSLTFQMLFLLPRVPSDSYFTLKTQVKHQSFVEMPSRIFTICLPPQTSVHPPKSTLPSAQPVFLDTRSQTLPRQRPWSQPVLLVFTSQPGMECI